MAFVALLIAGRLRFVLIRDIGDVFVRGDVAEEVVLETLRECCLAVSSIQ